MTKEVFNDRSRQFNERPITRVIEGSSANRDGGLILDTPNTPNGWAKLDNIVDHGADLQVRSGSILQQSATELMPNLDIDGSTRFDDIFDPVDGDITLGSIFTIHTWNRFNGKELSNAKDEYTGEYDKQPIRPYDVFKYNENETITYLGSLYKPYHYGPKHDWSTNADRMIVRKHQGNRIEFLSDLPVDDPSGDEFIGKYIIYGKYEFDSGGTPPNLPDTPIGYMEKIVGYHNSGGFEVETDYLPGPQDPPLPDYRDYGFCYIQNGTYASFFWDQRQATFWLIGNKIYKTNIPLMEWEEVSMISYIIPKASRSHFTLDGDFLILHNEYGKYRIEQAANGVCYAWMINVTIGKGKIENEPEYYFGSVDSPYNPQPANDDNPFFPSGTSGTDKWGEVDQLGGIILDG
jgi:hypothetical protein